MQGFIFLFLFYLSFLLLSAQYYLQNWFVEQIKPTATAGDAPEKKVTRLAIGVEGGFNPDVSGKLETKETYSVVLLPEFLTLEWPNAELPVVVSCFQRCFIKAQHFINIIF